jgi:hypothetical protein
MSADVINFPVPERQMGEPGPENPRSELPEKPAGFGILLSARMTVDLGLRRRYMYPKGVKDRTYDKLFYEIMNLGEDDPNHQAFMEAANRMQAAHRELEAAIFEQHKVAFGVMWSLFPKAARRAFRDMAVDEAGSPR